MKLLISAVCLALAVAVIAEDISSADVSPVFDYHRRFGIPRAAALRRAELDEVPDGRIVGGFIIDVSQVPYQAGLVITINFIFQSVCGASLISSNRLVTAAHCQHDGQSTANSMVVVLGTNTIFSGGVRTTTRDITMHPSWNPRNAFNDIAVIRIGISVGFTNVIQPISLPDAHQSNSFSGWTARASGFGRTTQNGNIPTSQRISAVDLPVITNAQCTAVYPAWMHNTNICTNGAGGRGTCNGDSGGPLAVPINGVNFLIGVTSYGSPRGCQAGDPAAFARVTSFISWIRSI